MRECLGWITNCTNKQSCPQNWLELSVSELPTQVRCHVCDSEVALVTSEDELQGAGGVAAFPVVPCIGLAGGAPAPSPQAPAPPPVAREPKPPPKNGASGGRARAEPKPEPKLWYCGLQNGESIKLDKDTMIIGRSRTCDIVIPSAKVSRQHASLTRVNDEYYIEDLGSANGVWLRGEKISRTKVAPGDVYTISDETLTFEQK